MKLHMKKTDGFTLASAAAALMMSGTGMAAFDVDSKNPEAPIKISLCQSIHAAGQSACKGLGNDAGAGANSSSDVGFVAVSTGNANFSAAMCQVMGGSEAAQLTAMPDTELAEEAVYVAYCNDVFTCAGLSACKGNANTNGAGQNTCHGIGFVGVYTGDKALSDSLCEKLGGTVLSSL